MTGRSVVGVVVGHSLFASALVDAVERISGETGALRPLSNKDCSPKELEDRVLEEAGPGPAIVFVDLASGSCAFAARRVGLRHSGVAVITGVNLPMLLDFVFHREMELEALVERVARKGNAGMEVAVSGGRGSGAEGEEGAEPRAGDGSR